MTTITQRKKGWWKIWVLLGLIAAVTAIVAILAMLEIIDLAPLEAFLLSIPMWESENILNFAIGTTLTIIIGIAFAWIYYSYLRGQKVTTTTAPGMGYNPVPTTPSQPQSQNETVIS